LLIIGNTQAHGTKKPSLHVIPEIRPAFLGANYPESSPRVREDKIDARPRIHEFLFATDVALAGFRITRFKGAFPE
jgi:hypothetical protein